MLLGNLFPKAKEGTVRFRVAVRAILFELWVRKKLEVLAQGTARRLPTNVRRWVIVFAVLRVIGMDGHPDQPLYYRDLWEKS